MPGRVKKPCSHPGCKILVSDGFGKCQRHRTQWEKPASDGRRIKGRALQEARGRLFQRQPLCEECQRAGRVRVATIRDHKVPIAEGGADDQSNEQALCVPCHDVKSEAERLRGVARSR